MKEGSIVDATIINPDFAIGMGRERRLMKEILERSGVSTMLERAGVS